MVKMNFDLKVIRNNKFRKVLVPAPTASNKVIFAF